MRAPVLAFSLVLLASGAAAQTPDLDRLRLQTLQQDNMRAQEQVNIQHRNDADVRQAIAEQQRRQTQANTASLALRSAPPSAPPDDDALRTLRDGALATHNARLRAITPAP